ncbi:hypothetical protein Gotur_020787 [Gossypium turneri]
MLITSLCLKAHVRTQANLKGRYAQGCITNYGLQRLVERVYELNQGVQEEPPESDTEESTDGNNQQQTYWKYAKIRDDSIQNTFKNISNTFVPEFPDAIFETWTEDTDDASGDGAKKDKGNKSEK